jgi:hypothetical protein
MTAAADTAAPSSLPDGLGDAARAFISSPQRLLIGAERTEAADGRSPGYRRPARRTSIARSKQHARRSPTGRGPRCRLLGARV